MEPQIRYCTTKDGVRIAYSVEGKGPPLVMTPVFVESFSFHHLLAEFDQFLKRLRSVRRVALYDARGTGLSQRDAHGGLDVAMLDMEAVVEICGEPVALWANLTYSIPAVRLAIARPDLVERLVLFASMARRADAFPDDVLHSFIELARSNWPLAAQTFGDSSTREAAPEAGLRWGEMYRQSTSAEAVEHLLAAAIEHDDDIRGDLARVTTPTLVLHRRGDLNVPLELGQQIAAGIPDALFVPLDGVITAYPMGDQEQVLRAALPFLGGAASTPADELGRTVSGLATILFTDIESSTSLTQRLGDAKAQELVRTHNAIVRDALRAHGGSEIKHTGDGIMASFSSASGALECSVAIQRGVAARAEEQPETPLAVRIGLNAGEPVAEEDDLFGASVQLAKRICDHADPGQIVVSNVVRELATGKGFLFADLGEVVPKGFEETVHLFEVRWRGEGGG